MENGGSLVRWKIGGCVVYGQSKFIGKMEYNMIHILKEKQRKHSFEIKTSMLMLKGWQTSYDSNTLDASQLSASAHANGDAAALILLHKRVQIYAMVKCA